MGEPNEYADESLLTDLPLWADADARTRLASVCEAYSVPVDNLRPL